MSTSCAGQRRAGESGAYRVMARDDCLLIFAVVGAGVKRTTGRRALRSLEDEEATMRAGESCSRDFHSACVLRDWP